MAGAKIALTSTAGELQNDGSNNAQVNTPGFTAAGVVRGGGVGNAGGVTTYSSVDEGEATASRDVRSPECDDDYRERVAHDNTLDQETFNSTAQNTGKHIHAFTTLTATMSAAGLLTNSGNITTTTTGMTFGTTATFRCAGTETLVCETSVAFTAQPNTNTVIDFGLFLRGATTAFAPLDGVYFRMNSAGMFGVVNNSGVETPTGVFPLALGAGTFVYSNNAVNRYLIQVTNHRVTFWINNIKYGEIATPIGAGFPCKSTSLPWSVRHAIVGGAAGAATQALISDYRVYLRGPQYADRLSIIGNRVFGSYQGLSGGTMGSLATIPLNTVPTAAVPSGTALTANLPGGLGGQGVATAGATSANDLIFGSYQLPAATIAIQGRRLVIRGVVIDALNTGAAVATTATVIQWGLAFGHTAVSLATAEGTSFSTATTKAPRRISLAFHSWAIGSAIGSAPMQGPLFVDFGDSPVYISPGEFVALTGKWLIGTATASQTITYTWQPIYGWE